MIGFISISRSNKLSKAKIKSKATFGGSGTLRNLNRRGFHGTEGHQFESLDRN